MIYDVVVVGGGVSGIYNGWRLINSHHEKESKLAKHIANSPQEKGHIAVLETSDRIGGRLFSITHDDIAPSLTAEVGGMRFQKRQQSVYNLIEHLGMTEHIVPFGSAKDGNYQYVRGQHFTTGDYNSNPDSIPFKLYPRERGKSPAQLQYEAIFAIYPELKGMALAEMREYLKAATFMGKPLWQVGFWNLLLSRLSNEAYHLIREAGGYYWIISNWNAYDAIPEIVFQYEDPEFFRLNNGFQQRPLQLSDEFVAAGGELRMNTNAYSAVTVSHNGEELIELKVKTHTDADTNKEETLLARHVVMALPPAAINSFSENTLFFSNEQFVKDLETVSAEPADKLFMWFDQEWWTGLGLTAGSSNTDLPMRQCYYFGTEKNLDDKFGNSGLLMATYNDGIAVGFWSGFLPSSRFTANTAAKFENRFAYHQDKAPPADMINELVGQLSTLHQIKVPQPHTAVYQNWTWPPFGGGWHFWNPHEQSWTIMPRIRKPVDTANIYLCGEAFSASQGWVEGAINTSEMVLQNHFGLKRPSWVDQSYNFGP